MEFALPELLNREEIIKILNQRQLNVQNMSELTLDELLKVYKTFVMPLSRRPERGKKSKHITSCMSTIGNVQNKEHMQIECSDSSSNAMDIDLFFEETRHAKQLPDRMTSPAGEKRRQRSSDEDSFDMFDNDYYQHQLSSVTKRIRINSLT